MNESQPWGQSAASIQEQAVDITAWDTRGMTAASPQPPSPPRPPKIDRSVVDALIDFARAQAAFWQWHVDEARLLRKPPGEQAVLNVTGWTFVEGALAESFDDLEDDHDD